MRHRFHSLCPYFAMFPESFAERWIARLTRKGDTVLDPFSGRGTTAFQALLMGRRAVACDINDVAYCLTRAKTCSPDLPTLLRRILALSRRFDGRRWASQAGDCAEFFHFAFARRTLQQLLFLRANLKWNSSDVDAMVAALVLGSLHGEMDKSASYLSNQMPRTISTKPAYSIRFWRARRLVPPVRDVFELLEQRAKFRYASDPPKGEALVLHGDMRELSWQKNRLPRRIVCAITSPPYLDVTSFEEDQWLRLWFLGGPPYPTPGRLSRDDRHSQQPKYWEFIADIWRCLGRVMFCRSNVVIRIGCRQLSPERLKDALTASSRFSGRRIELVESQVSQIKNRQTEHFRPGSRGCAFELDCHYRFIN